MLTIRQVANILDAQEKNSQASTKPFHQLAIEMKYLSATEADALLKAQESTGLSINQLLIECGLLTESQNRVLYSHFRSAAFRSAQTVEQTKQESASKTPAAEKPSVTGPRQPNFKRRPMIIQNQEVPI